MISIDLNPFDWAKAPHKQVEKRLVANGSSGQAEVLESMVPVTFATSGVTYDDSMLVPWDLALRVTPEVEPAFDVRLCMRIHTSVTLSPGIVFPVLHDPGNHERMVYDPRALPKTDVEAEATYQIGALGAMGVDTTGLAEKVKSATDVDSAAAMIDRAVGEKAAAANNAAMAETLKERREGTRSVQPPAEFAPDVESRIEQLARLKDAGLIDEQQYETKRQRLIDQL